jgi:hypothetical protein
MVHLKNRFRPKLGVKSLNNVIPSLTGQGLHDALQRYLRYEDNVNKNWQIERRLLSVINGVRVAGRFDALYDNKVLYDFKVTRAWKFEKGDYTDWEIQLNCYDYMLSLDGIQLESLKIAGIVLDWQSGKVWKQGYPQSRFPIIDIKKWSVKEQEKYLSDKVTKWSTSLQLPSGKLPLCSAEERWASKPVWKLFRTKSSKRATKVFPSQSRAKAYLQACQIGTKNQKKWDQGYITKHVDTPFKRCEDWCDVSTFCNQFNLKIEV